MRRLKDFSLIAFLTGIGITTILVAQLQAGCFKEGNASCAIWYNTVNPFPPGVNIAADCTQNYCPCSGDPTLPAGEENPSFCGCGGIVTVHINTTLIGAFPCPVGNHVNCKDDYTIRKKGNGEYDTVECAHSRTCDGCEPQPLEGPNGELIFVQNICGPPGTPRAVIANQAEVIGNPC